MLGVLVSAGAAYKLYSLSRHQHQIAPNGWNFSTFSPKVLDVKNREDVPQLAFAAGLYLLIYSLAAYADLWTTMFAIRAAGAHEGNVFSTSGSDYMVTRALLINIGGAVIMTACVMFSANYVESMDPQWLLRPMASFGQLYLNPWSPAAIRVSPLHMLSLALGFVVLRLLAAGNNLMIYFFGVAPIGEPIKIIAQHTSGVFAFTIVLVPLFYVLAIGVSPIAAKLLSFWRR
jgi:hypothetical protein